jgi:hypothetical protein
MPHDFVPRADGKFLLWVRNLVEQLQSDPDGYQMPADMVQQLAMLTADFETAYAAITSNRGDQRAVYPAVAGGGWGGRAAVPGDEEGEAGA